MPIGDVIEVRDLTGISDVIDLPDSRIETALGYGRGELYAITLKTDWDTDLLHPLYQKAKMLTELYAAYWILIRYVGYADKARLFSEQFSQMSQTFKDEYNAYLMTIEPATGGPGSKFSVVASSYQTFPLNPDGYIPHSSVIIPGD